MQRRIGAIEQDLKHDVIRARLDRSIALHAHHNLVCDDVPQVARREHRGFHERERAVVNHPLVLAIDQPDRQSAVVILARQDHIKRIIGEHLCPIRQPLLVERLGVSGVEGFDLVMQQHRLQLRVERRAIGRGMARDGGFAHASRVPFPRASAGTWRESMLPRSSCRKCQPPPRDRASPDAGRPERAASRPGRT